ncbi:MAG TPA: hypothetical protein VJH67_00150 [Candidatus Paceibacterota bacterium]
MKLLHQLGHNHKWALDAFFENNIGDGFILSAFSIEKEKIGQILSGYSPDKYLPVSFLDLQFYAGKDSLGGKLDTYGFHPINHKTEDTEVSTLDAVMAGVKFQEKLGFKNILIPNIYIDPENPDRTGRLIKEINKRISKERKENILYFMTIPIIGSVIDNDSDVEKLLQELTDMDICFDGYYVVCESNLEFKKKISTDYKYYINLSKILTTLKKQDFKTMLGFSNIDALVFSTMADIDYITIGTYENLRKFSIKRFTEESNGGASEGWYYSGKILNFIKARQIEIFRGKGLLNLIKNQDNVFSDVILTEGYQWNTHRPDVHKNYLVEISRQLKELNSREVSNRSKYFIEIVEKSRGLYHDLESKGVYLDDESSNYHLATWLSVIK